jgi:hypothetical protein
MQTAPTWFLQSASVNKDGTLADGDRWFTLGAHDESMAEYHAERLAEKGGHIPITDSWRLSKSEDTPIGALRTVSLLELLREGPESPSVYFAILDLSDGDFAYRVNTFLGYED